MEHKQKNATPRRGRRSYWSVVDTVILLLVLTAIAGIVYRVVVTVSREQDKAQDPGTVCEVYFEVMETHRDVLAELRGFETVYLYDNDMRLGAIGATIDPVTGNTVAALTVNPIEGTERATATGCMICRGSSVKNGVLSVEGTGRYLTLGSELMIRTDRVLLTVRITDIKVRS